MSGYVCRCACGGMCAGVCVGVGVGVCAGVCNNRVGCSVGGTRLATYVTFVLICCRCVRVVLESADAMR